MRNLIDLITEASLSEDAPQQMLHLRVYRQMQKLVSAQPTDEDSAQALMQDIDYLKDAIQEFGDRQRGEMQMKMFEIVSHLSMYMPMNAQTILAHPEDVMSEIKTGMNFLHKQLKAEGVIVEAKA